MVRVEAGAPATWSLPLEGAAPAPRRVNLVAKWNKSVIELVGLDETLRLGDLKEILHAETAVPPERQRLVGLKTMRGKAAGSETRLCELVLKLPVHKFLLMGTPDEQLLSEPADRPAVLDDLGDDDGDAHVRYSAWEWQRARRGELSVEGAAGGAWRLAWADTFEYDGPPDPARWEHQVSANSWVHGPTFDERQWYTSAAESNAWVSNGRLRLEARREPAEDGCAYTSARLTTRGRGDFKYGRVEVCAKLPPARRGLWPAIWLMPTRSRFGQWPLSGEVDIMENVGYEAGVVRASVHTSQNHRRRGNHARRVCGVRDAHENFHVYAVEWDEQQLAFFVDDRCYFKYANKRTGPEQWPFDEDFHLILNVAIGGTWGGRRGIDDAAFPCAMELAFVKVFQRQPPDS